MKFLIHSHKILAQWKVSGSAVNKRNISFFQSIACMIELIKYMHITHNFACVLPREVHVGYDGEKFRLVLASQWWEYFHVYQTTAFS